MRSRLPLISALLVLALLLGPAFAAAHDGDHGLQAGAAHCVVCVYAHSAGAGALPAVPLLTPAFTSAPPDVTHATLAPSAVLNLHPIRGPPAFLA